jgi:hypothetical protein
MPDVSHKVELSPRYDDQIYCAQNARASIHCPGSYVLMFLAPLRPYSTILRYPLEFMNLSLLR